ncbi:hypothetical protein SAMN04489712_10526 [Thermomonospora echinospora]|uniref:Uncharacterized protein n=1 Tax=Thermomonospora echinospora TaxID=1992 RepID=A0A1H5ZUY0_9ACTN|nr:hypothetical protein [Thermomonospora echinospora]SEG40298.1 hypothetical protein SAMN04489712_10526 [Thermomonospora echinospora]
MTSEPTKGSFGPLPEHISEHRADHVGSEFDTIVDLCRQALQQGALQYVAYYIRGNWQVWLDVFDPRDPFSDLSPEQIKRERDSLLTGGQQLHFVVARLDQAFTPVQRGRLIRCVFDVGAGALLYFSPSPGEYLVGATLHDERISGADASMVWLSEEIRLARGFGGTPNYAGEHSRYEVNVRRGDIVDDEDVYVDTANPGGAPSDMLDLCRAVLDPEAVHYVACFQGAEPICSVDLLAHPGLAALTFGTDSRDRRRHYQRIGKLLYLVTNRLDRTLLPLLGGVLGRTVLDVEAGALFYLRASGDRFVIGITLDQAKVAVADEQLGELARALAARPS